MKTTEEIDSKIIKTYKYAIEKNEDLEKVKTINRTLQGVMNKQIYLHIVYHVLNMLL